MKRTHQSLRVAVLVGAVIMVGGYIVYRSIQRPPAEAAPHSADAARAAADAPGPSSAANAPTSAGQAPAQATTQPFADDTHFFGSKSAPTFEPPKPPAQGAK